MKIVAWWKSAWRLWSIRLTAFAVAVQTFVATFPDAALQAWLSLPQEMKALLPPNFLQWIALLIGGTAIWARLVPQPKAKAIMDEKLAEDGKPSLQEDLAAKLAEGRSKLNCPLLVVLFVGALLVSSLVQAQSVVTPTGTFTVTPVTGSGSVTPKLTWNVQNAASCTAGGGWSGNKAVSGTETLAAVTANANYTLTCFGPAPAIVGSLLVTWTSPTENTDSSPLTNLWGYKIYYTLEGDTATRSVKLQNPSLTAYKLDTLAPGNYTVSMTSLNATNGESARSNSVTAKVTGTSVETPKLTLTTSVTVTPVVIPNPPTNLKAVEQTVWRLDQALDAIRLVEVGSVPLGTKCDDKVTMMGLFRVDRMAVAVKAGYIRPNVALAKCAQS